MGELIIIFLFLILSLLIVIFTYQLPDIAFQTLGPSVFPRIIGFVLLFLSLLYIIDRLNLSKKQGKPLFSSEVYKNLIPKMKSAIYDRYQFVLITLINFFILIILMQYFGFRISNFLFLAETQWMISPKKLNVLPVILFTSLLITFGLFYFFQYFLNVHFPEGIFFEYMK